MRQTMKAGRVRARRPLYLFSKLTKCGVCGGGYNVWSGDLLRCFNKTKRGTCSNTRAIKRQELEERVLRALKERFLGDALAFDEFCAGSVARRHWCGGVVVPILGCPNVDNERRASNGPADEFWSPPDSFLFLRSQF